MSRCLYPTWSVVLEPWNSNSGISAPTKKALICEDFRLLLTSSQKHKVSEATRNFWKHRVNLKARWLNEWAAKYFFLRVVKQFSMSLLLKKLNMYTFKEYFMQMQEYHNESWLVSVLFGIHSSFFFAKTLFFYSHLHFPNFSAENLDYIIQFTNILKGLCSKDHFYARGPKFSSQRLYWAHTCL